MTIPLPKIEGFQPIPNSVMVPFMETQSAALAYAFGLNYEFGKRKIKSMDNETFNSLTSEQIEQMASTHTKVLLDGFIKKVPRTLLSQDAIFKQYVTIEKLKVEANVELARWLAENATRLASGTGQKSIIDTVEPIDDTQVGTKIVQDKQGNVTTTSPPSTNARDTLLAQIKFRTIQLYQYLKRPYTFYSKIGGIEAQKSRKRQTDINATKKRDELVRKYITTYERTTVNNGLLSQAINSR